MKVGLISFHNAYNYGAALQAYGLQRAIEDMGAECEYIDYLNHERAFHYDMRYQFQDAVKHKQVSRALRVLVGTPFINSRGRKFKDFYAKYLRKSEKVYHNSEEAKELNGVYDRFIVGSDQVWNNSNNGNDTAFLLDFVNDSSKKMSYSSSFGMSNVPDELVSKYKKYLNALGKIAVREVAGAELVEKLTDRKVHVVLDPVFLPGVSCWDSIANTIKSKERYVFFYTNSNSQVSDFLSTHYPMKGIKKHILSTHISVKDFTDKNTKIMVSMSPETFLSEIKNAELVVTASFHCVAFSIIFHKPFIAILTGNVGKDERIRNLLKLTGLEDRILRLNTTVKDIDKVIDYNQVDNNLTPMIDYSKNYLSSAIFDTDEPEIQNNENTKERYFCSDDRCYGCTACSAICPVNAIEMVENGEGFMIPNRDTNKCVDCHKCNEVCPVYNKHHTSKNFIKTYWALKNNDFIRKNSSSGGALTVLADYIFSKGGVVCAASMDGNFTIKHIFVDNFESLSKIRGTNYVQSDLNDSFYFVKDYLMKDIPVLFVGTPCQVAGILNFVDCTCGEKSELLMTCDIICHGAPSPLVFNRFISFLKSKGNLQKFNFRDKSLGWSRGYSVSAIINGEKIVNKLWIQSFSKMFSHNMINRISCANCAFTNYDRCGDVTIGDFWGIDKVNKSFADQLGVSLVICNTKNGSFAMNSRTDVNMLRVKKDDTMQNSLIKNAKLSQNRFQLFKLISEEENWETIAHKFGEVNVKGAVKEYCRRYLFKRR